MPLFNKEVVYRLVPCPCYEVEACESWLTDMAARRPHTPEEFLEVNGAGKKKAARYGAVFLEAIRAYEEEKGEETE